MGLNYMASGTKWYEELPTPWDMDCRGKFCLYKTNYDIDRYDRTYNLSQKYEFFKQIRQDLESAGKFDWLRENGVDLNSLKITGVINQPTYHLQVAVLIDLPKELRTMYALRFTE